MTNSTSEREQRLRAELTRRLTIARGIEIESGSAKDRAFVDGGIAAFEALLDDLSLLDSEAADGDDVVRPSTRQGEAIVKQARENAATRMRDLCVEKVKTEIPTSWLDSVLTGPQAVIGKPPYNCVDIERLLRAISTQVTTALQSLTLEQEQK